MARRSRRLLVAAMVAVAVVVVVLRYTVARHLTDAEFQIAYWWLYAALVVDAVVLIVTREAE